MELEKLTDLNEHVQMAPSPEVLSPWGQVQREEVRSETKASSVAWVVMQVRAEFWGVGKWKVCSFLFFF